MIPYLAGIATGIAATFALAGPGMTALFWFLERRNTGGPPAPPAIREVEETE